MNEIIKVIVLVIVSGVAAGVLVALGSLVGKFIKANAQVMAEPTPEQRDDWSFPVLGDVANPEHYPKTWAYRAERGAEATTEIPVGDLDQPTTGITYRPNPEFARQFQVRDVP